MNKRYGSWNLEMRMQTKSIQFEESKTMNGISERGQRNRDLDSMGQDNRESLFLCKEKLTGRSVVQ